MTEALPPAVLLQTLLLSQLLPLQRLRFVSPFNKRFTSRKTRANFQVCKMWPAPRSRKQNYTEPCRGSSRKQLLETCVRGSENLGRGRHAEGFAEANNNFLYKFNRNIEQNSFGFQVMIYIYISHIYHLFFFDISFSVVSDKLRWSFNARSMHVCLLYKKLKVPRWAVRFGFTLDDINGFHLHSLWENLGSLQSNDGLVATVTSYI